jgi:hypothetical protein
MTIYLSKLGVRLFKSEVQQGFEVLAMIQKEIPLNQA